MTPSDPFSLPYLRAAARHLLSMLRGAAPDEFKRVSEVTRAIQNLRTNLSHNLVEGESAADYKRRQADIWLVENGGSPIVWSECSNRLIDAFSSGIDSIHSHWMGVTSSPEDATSAIERFLAAIDRDWPGHLFDRMVESAVDELKLDGLDIVAYREPRLEQWRKLATLFDNTHDAESALRRAIRQELHAQFGAE